MNYRCLCAGCGEGRLVIDAIKVRVEVPDMGPSGGVSIYAFFLCRECHDHQARTMADLIRRCQRK